jgi:tRNA dimethylallyltransferase
LLISVVGPTAIGKTGLAIALAQVLETEILSADSRQFYRGIPIGTAAPTPEERAMAPHHFVEFLELQTEYSSGKFAENAVDWLQAFFSRRRAEGLEQIAIMVGGSGLYTQAVQEGFDPVPAQPEVRSELNAWHAQAGLAPLLEELQQRDPEHFGAVDRSNPHRVIRALEVCRITGETYTQYRKLSQNRSNLHAGGWTSCAERPWDTLTIGLNAPRHLLHARINERTIAMMRAGWLDEARQVLHMREANALRTVGYPQLFDVLEKRMEMDTAITRIQEATRQFARRQLTWFHRQPGVHWVDARQVEKGVALVRQFVENGRV